MSAFEVENESLGCNYGIYVSFKTLIRVLYFVLYNILDVSNKDILYVTEMFIWFIKYSEYTICSTFVAISLVTLLLLLWSTSWQPCTVVYCTILYLIVPYCTISYYTIPKLRASLLWRAIRWVLFILLLEYSQCVLFCCLAISARRVPAPVSM